MHISAGSRDGHRRWAAIIVAAVLAAACGSTASPTPGTTIVPSASASVLATATPAPTPSPTPDITGVAETALTKLVTPGVEADVSGTLTSTAGPWPVNGTVTLSGQDQRTDITVTEGTTKVETVAIIAAAQPFVAKGSGPFFAAPKLAAGFGPASGDTLYSVITSITALQDMGTETHAGQSLHHLKPTTTVAAAPFAFGLTDATIKGAAMTVDVYADDTGTPILMAIGGTWQQVVGRSTLALTAAFDVTFRAGVATVVAPDEVWATFSSKRFLYHAAKGTDWTLSTKNAKVDEIETTDDAFIDLTSVASHVSLTSFTNTAISVDTKDLGKKPEKNESIRVGGVPARLLTFHGTYKQTKLYFLDATVVYGGRAYDIGYTTIPGTEANDKATFLEFLATFGFGR